MKVNLEIQRRVDERWERRRSPTPTKSVADEKAVEAETHIAARAVERRLSLVELTGAKATRTEFERIIQTNDLVDELYLERGLLAARPVARIILRDGAGAELGYATGVMVSPRLLLTNWHRSRC